ncbi:MULTISPECIES: SprT family zinc-dependent metalloprotease [Shewanella]|uniref:SprT family zinc-dependent metalloprotease n=1 Tax=Shewanella algae TaxID=38313 RepID=UPI001AAD13DC|nr:SprT family zinc-dependent metalloprotease [Shewanella algae]QTE90101.1 SprT family zinc-dependent metalloprotease [Shewanella algae]
MLSQLFRSLKNAGTSEYNQAPEPQPQAAASEAQQAVLDAIELCYLKAEAALGRALKRPSVSFALRGRSAGTAHPTENRLRFNPVLLEQNLHTFTHEVVPHEICHLLCFQLHGKTRPHGKEWQSLMRRIYGLAPRTTHSMDISSVKPRTLLYQCGCGVVELSIRRHNKVVRGQAKYQCRRCGQLLSPQPS